MSQSSESPPSAGDFSGEFMLFGFRVKIDPMRKSASMNNLSDYEPVITNNDETLKLSPAEEAAAAGGGGGYATADDAVPVPIGGGRERKRGVPWTEEEHKLFLIGLQKVGKGDWRGISRNYVKTRTPTQVASHAQKYFLRRSNLNRRRRRSSLFDITTDSVTAMPIEKGKNHQEKPAQPQTPSLPLNSNAPGFSVVPFPVNMGPVLYSMQSGHSMENSANTQTDHSNMSPMLVHPVPVLPMSTPSPMVNFNLRPQVPIDPSQLSLRLSLSSGQDSSISVA